MLMELAMPKLRTRFKGLRRTSTSSSLGSQHTVLYKKPFRRTMSNETGTTELGSPSKTVMHYNKMKLRLLACSNVGSFL